MQLELKIDPKKETARPVISRLGQEISHMY